jgi:hypothetical protein
VKATQVNRVSSVRDKRSKDKRAAVLSYGHVVIHSRRDASQPAGSLVQVEVLDRAGDDKTRIDIDISGDGMKAGELTFEVTNSSHFLVREIFLVPLARSDGSLLDGARLAAGNDGGAELLGERSLEPGQSLTVSVTLAAGEYALFVDSVGFYSNMIWTNLTVT